VETNILYFDVSPSGKSAAEVAAALKGRGVLVLPTGPSQIRAVTHLDISSEEIEEALIRLAEVMSRLSASPQV